MLKDPILQVKELAGTKDADKNLQFFMDIFNIEDLVEKQKNVDRVNHDMAGIRSANPAFQS